MIPIFKFELSTKSVSIIPIADLHIGSPNSDWQEAIEVLDRYKDSYIMFLGDVINNSIKSSIGDIYEDIIPPSKAIEIFRDNFLIKYRERILIVILGNHENRSKKETDDSVISNICHVLGIPYADYAAVLDISFDGMRGSRKRINYSVAVMHGNSNGRFIEKSARQSRYFNSFIEGIDLYISAHTHVFDNTLSAIWHYDTRNKKLSKRILRNIVVSPWVDDNYAVRKILPPSARAITEIILHGGTKKQIETRVIT